jgi:hypothetical protein
VKSAVLQFLYTQGAALAAGECRGRHGEDDGDEREMTH